MTEPAEVIEQLDGVRTQWWLYSALCAFLAAGVASLLLLALLVLVDMALTLPPAALQLACWLWCAVSVALLATAVWRAAHSQRSLEAVARRLELTFPQLENNLISLVQWSGEEQPSDRFRQAAIREAADCASDTPMETAASLHSRRRRWQLALQTPQDLLELAVALGVQLGLFILLSRVPQWSHSTDRLWSSLAKQAPAAPAAPRSGTPQATGGSQDSIDKGEADD